MSQTTTTTQDTVKEIDFGAIVQELTSVINTERHATAIANFGHRYRAENLREFYTVGFTTVRQTGATWWEAGEILNDPHSVIVMLSGEHCRLLIAIANQRYPDSSHLRDLYRRVLPWKRVYRQIKQGVCLPDTINKIYVDQSVYVFDQLKRMAFYNWVAGKNPANPYPTIILVN